MTEHEKRSLQYRLARRFDSDPRRIMEIIREEIKKTPLTEEPPKGEWIPLTTRPMTDEEREHYRDWYDIDEAMIFDCPLPDDGQEVLISWGGNVCIDTFYNDDGCYVDGVDIGDVDAWMPLPEPYKSEKPETCKGCLEPCIMYEPDMRACKHKVTERGE